MSKRTEDAWSEIHRSLVLLGRLEVAVFTPGVRDADLMRRIRAMLRDHDPDGLRQGFHQLQPREFIPGRPHQ